MRRRALLGTVAAGVVGAAGCLSALRSDDSLGVPVSETSWANDWRAENLDRVVVDRGSVYRTGVSASREVLTLPTTGVTFRLRNWRPEPVKTNPHRWTLWRHGSDGWRGVYPDAYLQPQTTLLPGQSLTWDVRIDNRGTEQGTIEVDAEGEMTTLAGVGPGRYAASNVIHFADQWVLAVSVFRVVEE